MKRSENPKVEFWANEASLKRAPSEQLPKATGSWTLKRAEDA